MGRGDLRDRVLFIPAARGRFWPASTPLRLDGLDNGVEALLASSREPAPPRGKEQLNCRAYQHCIKPVAISLTFRLTGAAVASRPADEVLAHVLPWRSHCMR
jgi:hypothetical protein